MTKTAYLEGGEGWWLYWAHPQHEPNACSEIGDDIAWPFGVDEVKDESQMIAAGFTMAD
jgi:hypothetical protein